MSAYPLMTPVGLCPDEVPLIGATPEKDRHKSESNSVYCRYCGCHPKWWSLYPCKRSSVA